MAIEKAETTSGGAEIETSSSLARLHKVVLGWDYLRLLSDSKNKKQPEGLKAVKNIYVNFNEYIRVFEPLLFEEIKAQIVQGRDKEGKMDWQKGGIISCAESEGFHKFDEGVKPNAYAFALVENRGGQVTVTIRTFLAGEVKNLETAVPEHSHRLLQISYLFQPATSTTARFLWILKSRAKKVFEYAFVKVKEKDDEYQEMQYR